MGLRLAARAGKEVALRYVAQCAAGGVVKDPVDAVAARMSTAGLWQLVLEPKSRQCVFVRCPLAPTAAAEHMRAHRRNFRV